MRLQEILIKFIRSGWDLISIPSQAYLDHNCPKEELIQALKQADIECGSCGCDFDALYKEALQLLTD